MLKLCNTKMAHKPYIAYRPQMWNLEGALFWFSSPFQNCHVAQFLANLGSEPKFEWGKKLVITRGWLKMRSLCRKVRLANCENASTRELEVEKEQSVAHNTNMIYKLQK